MKTKAIFPPKNEIKLRKNKLLKLTSAFCTQKLDQEYFELCERLINKLSEKSEDPFQKGKLEIWAAAVIHALGTINFLFDKSFQPYISTNQISEYFDSSYSSFLAKSKEIRNLCELWYFDSEFSTRKIKNSNPFNNYVLMDN